MFAISKHGTCTRTHTLPVLLLLLLLYDDDDVNRVVADMHHFPLSLIHVQSRLLLSVIFHPATRTTRGWILPCSASRCTLWMWVCLSVCMSPKALYTILGRVRVHAVPLAADFLVFLYNNNNNNNNNNHDNVYGAVVMGDPLREFTRFI